MCDLGLKNFYEELPCVTVQHTSVLITCVANIGTFSLLKSTYSQNKIQIIFVLLWTLSKSLHSLKMIAVSPELKLPSPVKSFQTQFLEGLFRFSMLSPMLSLLTDQWQEWTVHSYVQTVLWLSFAFFSFLWNF